jgi:iron uptake system component EfeO
MPTASRKVAVALVSVVSLAALAACGNSSDGDAAKAAGGASSPAKGGATQVKVTLASGANGDTCAVDATSVPAGPTTFTIVNQSATGISEVELMQDQKIIGEKENLAPGLAPVSLTLTLGGGDYQLYCPGASKETVSFTVTGKAGSGPSGTAADLLAEGATDYATYVTTQLDGMVTAVKELQEHVDAGDLAAAQREYGEARPFYEKIESDVDGFVLPGYAPTDNHGNLDYLIDMRASNLDPAVGWHGFHAVERDLFQAKKITAKTKKLAAELTANVQKLAQLSTSLTYKPEDLANGAAGLLEEVQKNKISGEEENYSHIDLVDFAGNVEGAEQAFAFLKPGLTALDASMTDTIAERFEAVNDMLDGYHDPAQIGGYERYTAALKASAANKLSQSVQALQDSLAHLAEKVATA